MLSDNISNLSKRLEQFENGEPIPAGLLPVIRRQLEAMTEMAKSMEGRPIPLNQQLTARHLKAGVTPFPIVARPRPGGRR